MDLYFYYCISHRSALMSKSQENNSHIASTKTYTIGFVLSVGLTLLAYILVINGNLSTQLITFIIMGLAAIQLVVQLVFFLHLGRESKPRWNITAFAFMVIMLLIIVIGSLWIMNNLNYNMMMSPQEMNDYMFDQAKKGF